MTDRNDEHKSDQSGVSHGSSDAQNGDNIATSVFADHTGLIDSGSTSSNEDDGPVDRNSDLRLPISTVSAVGDELSMQFEQASLHATDQEVAVPLTPQYESFKKLEVVPSHRINLMTKVYNIVAFVALALSAAIIISARVIFSESYKFPVMQSNSPVRMVDITVYEFPSYFSMVDSILSFIVFSYAVILFAVFTFIIALEGYHQVLNEQVWVIALLACSAIYLNPYEGAIRLRRDVMGIDPPSSEGGFSYVDIFVGLRYLTFSALFWLYPWLGAHSYRILNRRVSIRDWKFYSFKVIIILCYVTCKLSFLFAFRIVFSEVPFATLVSCLLLYSSAGLWPPIGIISVVVLTCIEAVISVLIAVDVIKTFRELRAADYARHRTKILGYRFFLHQQSVFIIVYIVTYIFLLFGLPIGIQILQLLLLYEEDPGRGSYFDVQYAPFGLHLCILAFISTEAYTNLPANVNVLAVIFPFLFSKRVFDPPRMEPVVYRSKEPPSLPGDLLDTQPNCFVMQTNIELFNLSWFVYYHGTTKESKLNVDLSRVNLKIRECLYDKATDTKAIVAESSDRIIFAFKGTSSSQNLMTDLKVNHRSLVSVIDSENRSPTRAGRELMNLFRRKRAFRRAKVHAGFAIAYGKIKNDIIGAAALLMQEKVRPVCFTGHSLGGALATLSSLDVHLTLGIEPSRLIVASFGSPRVGNEAFRELYDEAILTHWRFVAGGDLISRLPKIGYRHVGKNVVLTSTGELFIDPSALEIIFWHSQAASIVHHRKACYLLALKAWCDSRGDYVPNLWPFPISENDSRRFVSTFRKTPSATATWKGSPTGAARVWRPIEDRAARMQGYAEAIDALDGGNRGSGTSVGHKDMNHVTSERALQLWARIGSLALNNLRKAGFDGTLDTPLSLEY